MAASTAARTAGASAVGPRLARSSQACSMVACWVVSAAVMGIGSIGLEVGGEVLDGVLGGALDAHGNGC